MWRQRQRRQRRVGRYGGREKGGGVESMECEMASFILSSFTALFEVNTHATDGRPANSIQCVCSTVRSHMQVRRRRRRRRRRCRLSVLPERCGFRAGGLSAQRQPASQKRNFLPTSGPPPTTCENRLAAIPSGARVTHYVCRARMCRLSQNQAGRLSVIYIFSEHRVNRCRATTTTTTTSGRKFGACARR